MLISGNFPLAKFSHVLCLLIYVKDISKLHGSHFPAIPLWYIYTLRALIISNFYYFDNFSYQSLRPYSCSNNVKNSIIHILIVQDQNRGHNIWFMSKSWKKHHWDCALIICNWLFGFLFYWCHPQDQVIMINFILMNAYLMLKIFG